MDIAMYIFLRVLLQESIFSVPSLSYMVWNIFPCIFRIDVDSLEVLVTLFASNKHNM